MADEAFEELRARAIAGGSDESRHRVQEGGRLLVRDRLERFLDPGSFVENGLLARSRDPGDLNADAIVCGTGRLKGNPISVIANDPTVKAGAWGRLTVRKIIRQQEEAASNGCPLVYFVDSAGARLNEQFDLFLGRHHAGRIFYNQVRMSGRIPQACILFGPSPAGAAYIPAFCDFVVMIEGESSAFLGSPRMVEMAIGEKVSAEELAGARMHCETSGLGDYLASDDQDALDAVTRFLSYLPRNSLERSANSPSVEPQAPVPLEELIPDDHGRAYDMRRVLEALVDGSSTFEFKPLFAKELICALARLEGRPIGVVANQPMIKAGTLDSDSADKASHFIQLCDAYNLPLVFLCDTPGFMVGSEVERQGIIRHGAKMLAAIAEAEVPRYCIIIRKAYGAGYFAMSGGGFQPDAIIGLPNASAAIMGPEAAINAVYYNKINAIADDAERNRYVDGLREKYGRDVSILAGASEFLIDAVVAPEELRQELHQRLSARGSSRDLAEYRPHTVIRG